MTKKLEDYKKKMADGVLAKADKLKEVGYKKYLENK